MDEAAIERVLRIVDLIPPGQVLAYGEVGAIAGIGPRQVGAIMRRHGHEVAWWRVTNAAGDPPAHLRERALAQWADEGIELKANGLGCRIARFGADQGAIERRYAGAPTRPRGEPAQ